MKAKRFQASCIRDSIFENNRWCAQLGCVGEMMKKAGLLFLLTLIFHLAEAKKIDPPGIGIEAALEVANNYVKSQSIHSDDNYKIVKAEYLNMYNEYGRAHWNIRWERIPANKGGWFEVKIYQNSEIKVEYGE